MNNLSFDSSENASKAPAPEHNHGTYNFQQDMCTFLHETVTTTTLSDGGNGYFQ
jgi:hypothetical protein